MHHSGIIELSIGELRDIITGKQTYRKCSACDKSGLEYWDENGMSVQSSPHPSWGDSYESGPCEECDGVGYIPNPTDE